MEKEMLALILLTIGLIISAGILVYAETGIDLKICLNKNLVLGEISEKSIASQLAERSPFLLKMEDSDGREKIAILPFKLNLKDTQHGFAPQVGDIAIYTPMDAICIFYNDCSYSNRYIKLGHIKSGLKNITDQNEDFIAEWIIGK